MAPELYQNITSPIGTAVTDTSRHRTLCPQKAAQKNLQGALCRTIYQQRSSAALAADLINDGVICLRSIKIFASFSLDIVDVR